MTDKSGRWYNSRLFIRVAQVSGIAEMPGGVALLLFKHDEAQGYALLAIGAAAFGSMPWISRRASKPR